MALDTLVIGMLTEGLPFDGETAWTAPLGGSESAFSFMAAELAKRGHRVSCFTRTPVSKLTYYAGHRVPYYPLDAFDELAGIFEWDVLIVSRFGHWLSRAFKSRLNVLWNHDILTNPNDFMGMLWKTDLVMNNSRFHCEQYTRHLPELARVLWQTREGVDWDWIQSCIEGVRKSEPPVFVYASRPERGLEVLLKAIWPSVLEMVPDATLAVCGYDVRAAQHVSEEYLAWHDAFMRTVPEYPNVVMRGSLSKPEFYRLLASATAVLYPTGFPEIFCLVAAEAQACGTPIITTKDFALPEIVASEGCLVPPGEAYPTAFLKAVEGLLAQPSRYAAIQQEGRELIRRRFQWAQIAEEWEEKFRTLFEARWTQNKAGVLRRLMYNSDYLVARQYAAREGVTEVLVELDAVSIGGEELYVPTEEEWRDQRRGWKDNARWVIVGDLVEELGVRSVLDVGCGMGSLLTYLASRFEDVECVGVDFSSAYVEAAQQFIAEQCARPERVTVLRGDVRGAWEPGRQFDLVFAGELIEHLEDYEGFLRKLESWVKPGGRVVLTCPNGPVEAISYRKNGGLWRGLRLHVRHFEFRDLEELLREKDGVRMQIVPFTISPIDNALCAMWVLSWVVNGKPFGTIDFDRKVMTARPYQRVSFCTIVRNEENNLGRLLASVADVVDEIIVADTGSTDETVRVAEKYAAKVLHVNPDPDGDGLANFGYWRNASIKEAVGEWVLWGDGDEELIGGRGIRKYLDGPLYRGFVVQQVHLMMDFKAEPDVPVRLFRRGVAQFYGVLHEHAEMALDTPIAPVMILPDVKFAHFGYLTEARRRAKAQGRNLPLLLKDQRINPQRRLTWVFVQRDHLNMTEWSIEANRGVFTEAAAEHCRKVVEIYVRMFADPQDLYHKISFELYQKALRLLGEHGYTVHGARPFEVAMVLTGAPHGVQTTALDPFRRWFLTKKEFLDFMQRQGEALLSGLTAGAWDS